MPPARIVADCTSAASMPARPACRALFQSAEVGFFLSKRGPVAANRVQLQRSTLSVDWNQFDPQTVVPLQKDTMIE